MTVFNLERAFSAKAQRQWPKVYIAVDLHHTIIEGRFNRFNEGARVYPGAIEVLANWTKRPDISLILWTSSHADAIADIRAKLAAQGVVFDHVNSNPECPNGELCDFGRKWYFDVAIEDKSGFVGETDWFLIKRELIRIGEWS